MRYKLCRIGIKLWKDTDSDVDMEDLLIIVPRQSIDQQTQTDPLNISLYMDRSTQVDIDRTSRKRSNSRKPSLSRSGLFLPVKVLIAS